MGRSWQGAFLCNKLYSTSNWAGRREGEGEKGHDSFATDPGRGRERGKKRGGLEAGEVVEGAPSCFRKKGGGKRKKKKKGNGLRMS